MSKNEDRRTRLIQEIVDRINKMDTDGVAKALDVLSPPGPVSVSVRGSVDALRNDEALLLTEMLRRVGFVSPVLYNLDGRHANLLLNGAELEVVHEGRQLLRKASEIPLESSGTSSEEDPA